MHSIRSIWRVGHVARMVSMRNAHRILVTKSEGKRSPMWESNKKWILGKLGSRVLIIRYFVRTSLLKYFQICQGD